MATPVTLDEFKEWVNKNEHHTWSLVKGWGSNSTHFIKYFDLGFDTRTMQIYRISCRGSYETFTVHAEDAIIGEPKSLLDLLDYKLNQMVGDKN